MLKDVVSRFDTIIWDVAQTMNVQTRTNAFLAYVPLRAASIVAELMHNVCRNNIAACARAHRDTLEMR